MTRSGEVLGITALTVLCHLGCVRNGSGTMEEPPLDEVAGTDAGTSVVVINPSLHNTVLGRPTGTSVAVSVLAAAAGDRAFLEYSTTLSADALSLAGRVYSSEVVESTAGEPIVMELSSLIPNQRYFYRVQYQAAGGTATADHVHTFHTQRAPGSTFSFGVQGDTHPERFNNKMFNGELLELTMHQVRDRQPDLYFMVGDDFSIEKIIQDFKEANFEAGHAFQRSVEGEMSHAEYLTTISHPFERRMIVDGIGAPPGNASYRLYRENWLGLVANSTAIFLVNGNHEQAHAANLGGIFNNAAVWAADARLKYYPLPAPNGFYTGDKTPLTSIRGYPTLASADGLLRDYYAFTWGDALFVTIDPYWHSTQVSPDGTLFNGDSINDRWAATMGDEQYAWLQETLESSTARWKFVLAHHINGNGRGGAASVNVQEWGGRLADFRTHRPGWAKPIHQLLVDTGVTVFFQGHDHIFARERIDNVIYQSVPNPADNSYFAYNCSAYSPGTIAWQGPTGYGNLDPSYSVVLPNTGFVYVTVSPDVIRIHYVRTYRDVDLRTNPNNIFTGSETNGEIAFSYSIPPQPDDSQAPAHHYTCMGDQPSTGWVYNP